MTTEQLKELYATGEWILLTRFPWQEWSLHVLYAMNKPAFDGKKLQYKLIHKKHSEVLDHVLNGGSVESYSEYIPILSIDSFIHKYDVNAEYEIIKDKPSLNGHYCLATKSHYDKLVEDGYEDISRPSKNHRTTLCINGNAMEFYQYDDSGDYNEPMHLHNNEWVFGSLEYEEDILYKAQEEASKKDWIWDEPKPAERITIQSLRTRLESWSDDQDLYGVLSSILDYLEANQKEK